MLSGNGFRLGWFQAAIPAIVSGVASITNNIISSTAKKQQQLRELQKMREEIQKTSQANIEAVNVAKQLQDVKQASLIPGVPNEIITYGAIALLAAKLLAPKSKK